MTDPGDRMVDEHLDEEERRGNARDELLRSLQKDENRILQDGGDRDRVMDWFRVESFERCAHGYPLDMDRHYNWDDKDEHWEDCDGV